MCLFATSFPNLLTAETFCNCSNASGTVFLLFPGGAKGRVSSHPEGHQRLALAGLPDSVPGAGKHRREGDLFLALFPLLRSCLPSPQAAAENWDRSAGAPFSLGVSPPWLGIWSKLVATRRLRCPPGRPGVGWLNLSRAEHPEANAWESRGWRVVTLHPGRRQGSRRSRRARLSVRHRAPAALRHGFPGAALRSRSLPARARARARAVSLLAPPSAPPARNLPVVLVSWDPQHLAALAAWEGWRKRVTSAPFSSLSSPPPFP